MARLPRFDVPEQLQHVIQRGNNRSIIFVAEEDYSFYLQKLGEACQKFQCDLHADVTQAFRRINGCSEFIKS